jgi:hypothetical protein
MPSSAGEIGKELRLALETLGEQNGHFQTPSETVVGPLHEPDVYLPEEIERAPKEDLLCQNLEERHTIGTQ